MRIVGALGVGVVLDAVDHDAAVVGGGGAVEVPGGLIGLEGVENPVLEEEMGRVYVGEDRQPRRGHFPQLDEPTAALQIMLAPVAALPPRTVALDGLAVVDPLLGTVDPPEAQRHLHGIDIPHHPGALLPRPIAPDPELPHLIVVLLVPPIKLFPGVYVQ